MTLMLENHWDGPFKKGPDKIGLLKKIGDPLDIASVLRTDQSLLLNYAQCWFIYKQIICSVYTTTTC